MIDFAKTNSLILFDGLTNKNVIKVEDIDAGKVLWEQITEPDEPTEPVKTFNYVSFGDSIAAGHFIDDYWYDPPYNGGNSQIGVNGNTETLIVKNCYTDLIRNYLYKSYGKDNVTATSFAKSGSRVKMVDKNLNPLTSITPYSLVDLVSFNKDGVANYPQVIDAVREADAITICIGANDILEAALDFVMPYLQGTKDLSGLEAMVEENLIRLAGDGDNTSYKSLLSKFYSLIKPTANVVFTTVYNPLKYLHLYAGTLENDYMDSFLGVWLDTILGDIPIIGSLIKMGLMESEAVTKLYARINELSGWAERYIDSKGGTSKYFVKRNDDGTLIKDSEGNPIIVLEEYEQDKAPKWKGLNQIIRDSIADSNKANFMIAESHEVFDCVPDSQGEGELHYQDLVHVELSKGYDANDLPWENLWGDDSGDDYKVQMLRYWTGLVARHTSIADGINIDTLSGELIDAIIAKVLYPCLDVHPKAHGHYAMYRAFADTLGWKPLKTITFNANGGTSTMETQKVLDNSIVNNARKRVYSIINANAFKPQAHYHFTGWKADDGSSYSDKQAIYVPTNIVLSAQWGINTHTLTVVQGTPDAISKAKLFSRDYSNRQLDIGGYSRYLNSNKTTWDLPLKDTQTFEVAYGLPIKMVVTGNVEWITDIHLGEAPRPNCSISQYNGNPSPNDYSEMKVGKLVTAEFTMPDEDITIEYHFNYRANAATVYPSPYSHSYWLGYIGDKDLKVTYLASND